MSGPIAEDILPQGAITREKAWLLGFLAGDGHVQYDPANYQYKVFGCFGHDVDLARHGARLFESIYGVPCSVIKQKDPPHEGQWITHVGRKAVVEDLRSLAHLRDPRSKAYHEACAAGTEGD